VAAMLAILWTRLSDVSFRPFISAVVALGFREGDGAVDLERLERDSSLAPWFAGFPFDWTPVIVEGDRFCQLHRWRV
jgi:hypothetical protein